MKPAAKFLFSTSFDVDHGSAPATPRAGTSAPAAAARKPATYGEPDLAAAREQGHAAGRAEGEAAAVRAAQNTSASALGALQAALPGLTRKIDDGLAGASRLMLETALAGLQRLMPELSRRGGLVEVEGLLAQAIADLRDEARIVVRIHDSLLDELRATLDDVARDAAFEGRLVLLADEEIAPGDCRIEWAEGGVERVVARVWSDFEAVVMRALAAAPSSNPGPGGQPPQET